jgi:serine/threonine-protein kinase
MINLIGERLGDYQITDKLGQGGMADVYRATQTNVGREVAVKVIQPGRQGQPDFISGFEKEAKLIASFSHPQIVKVFSYGVLKGFHLKLIDPSADPRRDLVYFVMELFPGGTLADLIDAGPLPLEQVSFFLGNIAAALDYAHGKGVIHRDLKPQNVLLDENKNAFLADFGIAALRGQPEEPDPNGMILGTPYYMAPEQWEEQPTGPATDTYALGIMLWEMLTGKPTFDAENAVALYRMHKIEPVPSIQSVRKDLPAALDTLFARALAKDPANRYQTAGEMARDFEQAIKANLTKPGTSLPSGRPGATTTTSAGESRVSPDTRFVAIGGALAAIGILFLVLAVVVVLRGRTDNARTIDASSPPDQIVQTLVAATATARYEQTSNAVQLQTLSPDGHIQSTLAAHTAP